MQGNPRTAPIGDGSEVARAGRREAVRAAGVPAGAVLKTRGTRSGVPSWARRPCHLRTALNEGPKTGWSKPKDHLDNEEFLGESPCPFRSLSVPES